MTADRGSDRNTLRTAEVAEYVAAMARELKIMVKGHDLTTLSYLLDLVRLEAEVQADAAARFGGPRAGGRG